LVPDQLPARTRIYSHLLAADKSIHPLSSIKLGNGRVENKSAALENLGLRQPMSLRRLTPFPGDF
jgi:hypothetical protein